MFRNAEESHQHSLKTLNALYNYDDFMASIKTVVDLGCGVGLDSEWWATRTTREDQPKPLNIICLGIDTIDLMPVAQRYPNITYQKTNFEGRIHIPKDKFDVLWCHNSFQYAINPIQTLRQWRDIASDGAMLCLILPQTTNISGRDLDFSLQSGCYYNHTMVSLIYQLAVTGWDCDSGFFKKEPNDPWLHAVVYKSEHKPMDPRTTTWYQLAETGLLPSRVLPAIQAHGYLRQQDLLVPWLDKSLNYIK